MSVPVIDVLLGRDEWVEASDLTLLGWGAIGVMGVGFPLLLWRILCYERECANFLEVVKIMAEYSGLVAAPQKVQDAEGKKIWGIKICSRSGSTPDELVKDIVGPKVFPGVPNSGLVVEGYNGWRYPVLAKKSRPSKEENSA